MTSAIQSRGLTMAYGRKTAVSDVGFSVPAGAVYALLGRNGAGKSSLVRCLLGYQKPAEGSASLFGQDSWEHRARLMGRVGVVPEEPDTPPALTATQAAAFCRDLYPTWDQAGVTARLERFGVPAAVPAGSLSRGQKTQLALALALGPNPDLLILDDPTLGLDPVARRAFYQELLGDLADRGTTIFLTTHDLAGIEGIADRIGILREGRLIVDEAAETLKARHRLIRCGALTAAEAERALAPLAPVQVRTRAWGVEAVVAAFDEEAFQRLRLEAPEAEAEALSLEDLFMLAVATPLEVCP